MADADIDLQPAGPIRPSGATRPVGHPRVSPTPSTQEAAMSVARVTEITSTSPRSFEEAITEGIARATATLRHVKGAWIKDQRVEVDGNRITEYQVNMLVTFVLEEPGAGSE
jgi:flavin-binding protein dodecin